MHDVLHGRKDTKKDTDLDAWKVHIHERWIARLMEKVGLIRTWMGRHEMRISEENGA
jgi:hypothetical protein